MAETNTEKEPKVFYSPLSLGTDESKIRKSKDSIFLYLAAMGACFMMFSCGVSGAWSSPVIWKLRSNNTDINPTGKPLTTFQISLLTSLIPLGGIFGSLFFTKLCDTLGRKRTIMLLSCVTIFLNTSISLSSHVYIYFIARFLIGSCGGVAITAVSVFLNEISEDHNKGKIGCFIGLSLPFGALYVYILGPVLSVPLFTFFCSVPNIINILCFLLFIPESPFYLALKGKRKETLSALKRLRNKTPDDLENEYQMIIQTLSKTSDESEVTWKTLFGVKSLKKGFIIAVVLNSVQQFSGIGVILAYAGPLFDASGTSLKGDKVGILIGIANICGVLLAIMNIERLGRRPLLMISTLGGSVPHFLLGLFFYLKNTNSLFLNNILWLPVVSILGFIIVYAMGLGVIPPVIMSELFPSNARAKVSSVCTFCNYFLFFIVATLFPIVNDFFGPSWCLWSFSLLQAFSFLFVYFAVPEIKGKSLIQIQELLSK